MQVDLTIDKSIAEYNGTHFFALKKYDKKEVLYEL